VSRNALIVAIAAMVLPAAAGASPIAAMRDHRRIVLIAAPGPDDPALARQRAIVAQWHAGADDRDVSVVEVAGMAVTGASDAAATLRRRYRLDRARFQVLLIGKDGHVALRATAPVAAETLQRTIDAMPMRKAGER
jgi:hypothetical protein